MALIKDISDNTHLIRDYDVAIVKSRKRALEWIALISKKEKISIKRIELKDFESFDDGTVSDTLSKIEDTNKFIESYANSTIEVVSLVGSYDNSSFNLSVNLDSGYISICSRKKEQLNYESLEKILDLN